MNAGTEGATLNAQPCACHDWVDIYCFPKYEATAFVEINERPRNVNIMSMHHYFYIKKGWATFSVHCQRKQNLHQRNLKTR